MRRRQGLTIRHLTWGTIRFEGALRALVPSFEKKHPGIRIDIDGGRDSLRLIEIYNRELASRSGTYGVIQLAGQHTPTFAEPMQILPLDDYIDDQKIGIRDMDDYPKLNWEKYTYRRRDGDEHVFGVPTDTNACIMYDRKDIVEKHGFDRPPATLDESSEVIRATHDPPDRYGFLCELEGWYAAMLWYPLIWDYGGEVVDVETREVLCDSEEGLRALELELDWHRRYGVPGEQYWDRTDFNEHMGNKGTGVLCPSMGGNGMPQNPKVSRYAKVVGTARVPAGPKGRYTPMYGVGCVIPAKYRHPKEAFQWIEFQQRKGANVRAYCRGGGQPARESALRDPEIQKLPNCRHFEVLADTIKYDARECWKIPEEFMIEDITGEECYAALLGKKTPKQALADMERRLIKMMKVPVY